MGIVVRGLPVLVETGGDSRPVAFWWLGHRYVIEDYVCLWDDGCDSTAHWLVQADGGRPVSLIYDRGPDAWLMEWIEEQPSIAASDGRGSE
ncbi:MAG: hypothetical protein GXX94_06820 [Chloroflexi bacterium]|nr:hypothetical protein [Chloroflexota bacterium]